MPAAVAWVLATLFVAAFAAFLGLIILRVKGHYFAIGSIAIVELTRLIISSWESVTGGGARLNVTLLQGLPTEVASRVLYTMLLIAIIVFLVSVLVDKARLGFGLRCINQNEDECRGYAEIDIGTKTYKIERVSKKTRIYAL